MSNGALAVVGVVLGLERRRPASWMAFLAAACASWWLGRAVAVGWLPLPWPAVAIAAGAAVAAAAVGGLPSENGTLAGPWAAARAVWPAAGIATAAAAGLFRGVPPACAVVMLASAAVTSAVVAAAARRGTQAADAATLALTTAASAAAAAACGLVVGESRASTAVSLAAAATAGLAAACGCGWLLATARARGGDPALRIAGAAYGPLGRRLAGAAMPAALAGMAVWLFLVPAWAWSYAALAACWIACCAVPAATLGPGPQGESARRRLCASAAGSTSSGFRRAAAWRSPWQPVAVLVAFFAWPPVVAAVLSGATPAGLERIAIAAAIAAVGAVLAAAAALVIAAGGSRETALAAALTAGLAIAGWSLERGGITGNPSVPGARTAVEHSGHSCKTPRGPQGGCPRSPFLPGAVSCQEDPSSPREPSVPPRAWPPC